jgi:S1-C subfamily serine protease
VELVSFSQDVIRTLPGKILGIGPDKIEVDCEFICGNSGGPIVNSDGRLLALASFNENPYEFASQTP